MSLIIEEAKPIDFQHIVDYFLNSSDEFLTGMGVDVNKLPKKERWVKKLSDDYKKTLENRQFFYVLWKHANHVVGHSNLSDIKYGKEAKMHLHIWDVEKRAKGIGIQFLKQTLPLYFDKFQLKKLICEPMATNDAPKKLLLKTGFKYIKTYAAIPGWINFHQEIDRYELTVETF